MDTLSREQALTLYIACINYGRKPVGAVPTDLSGIENLQGIPPEEMNRFRHRQQNNGSQHQSRQPNATPINNINGVRQNQARQGR